MLKPKHGFTLQVLFELLTTSGNIVHLKERVPGTGHDCVRTTSFKLTREVKPVNMTELFCFSRVEFNQETESFVKQLKCQQEIKSKSTELHFTLPSDCCNNSNKTEKIVQGLQPFNGSFICRLQRPSSPKMEWSETRTVVQCDGLACRVRCTHSCFSQNM